MKENEELLQRCFDNDLNDEEMKKFFGVLSRSAVLRGEYRSFQEMRIRIRSERNAAVPVSLDRRLAALLPEPVQSPSRDYPPLRRFFRAKVPVSVAAMAAVLLIMIIGGSFAALNLTHRPATTHYVYVAEYPMYVVQSSHQNITNN